MIRILEVNSKNWILKPTLELKIDRSGITVSEYLTSKNVQWIFDDRSKADVSLYKGELGAISIKRIASEMVRRLTARPFITLIGEPREVALSAYLCSSSKTTLAVAPGDTFRRLYYASEWTDPKLEDWRRRFDRLCWIARPTAERISLAAKIIDAGIPLDIYSRQRWPFDNWKGFAENELTISANYRYRIVFENSGSYGYHSEKMFNSIRSGCVTFYLGDPSLNLAHAAGTFLPLTIENLRNREDLCDKILYGINRFMFTDAWEIYSFKKFYERIIDLAKMTLETGRSVS